MPTVTGRLTSVDRLNSSRNGNPRFTLTLDDTNSYRTIVDGSVGYEVSNYRIGTMVTLTLNRREMVEYMVKADG